MSSLGAWLKQRGLWRSASDGSDKGGAVTHVFLNGGKASVERAEDREAFLRMYARDVVAGRALYAVERTVGASYRMFADIDVPTERGDHRLILEIVRAALSRAPSALRVGEVSVCTRSAHEGKIGAHLIWSDLVRVDDARAMALRNEWVDALSLGGDAHDLDWGKTLDASVYRSNGLRMPWSLKRGGSQLAAYVPSYVASWRDPDSRLDIRRWEHGEDEDLLEDEVYARLVRCSIAVRPQQQTQQSQQQTQQSQQSQQKQKQPRKRKLDKATDDGSSQEGVLRLSPEERAAIRDALPRELYGECEVGLRCFRWTRGGSSGLSVSSTSRYCQAVGREHRSNHVFFDLEAKRCGGGVTVHQRCHRCADARVETRLSSSAVVGILRKHLVPPVLATRGGGDRKKRACPSLFPASAATAASFWLSKIAKDGDHRPSDVAP